MLLGVFLFAQMPFAQKEMVIYMPIAGQSKATAMKNFRGDEVAGTTELERVVQEKTGYEAHAVLRDPETRRVTTVASGGSIMDGDNTSKRPPEKIFWYPNANKPGKAGAKMARMIKYHYEELREAQDNSIYVAIPWLQGEADIPTIAVSKDSGAQVARYKQATKDLFEYVQAELGKPANFFIVLTGFPDVKGMENRGWSKDQIGRVMLATKLVRQTQQELIAENDNIFYAGDTDGFETVREATPDKKPKDVWHLSDKATEELGVMIGKHISAHLKSGSN